MQQIQPVSPGAMPVSLSVATGFASPEGISRHEGLVLIGTTALAMQPDPLPQPVLQRLLSPAARIEGADCRLNDPALIDSARLARAFVMLLPPLGNLCNLFYSVHPRRNDRFLAARPPLKSLFPEVDFTEFDFTGHMLGALAATCPERFAEMRRHLRITWQERLATLLAQLPDNGVLLHLPGPLWLGVPAEAISSPQRPVVTVGCENSTDAVSRARKALEPALRRLHA